jgi:hypothetical protein
MNVKRNLVFSLPDVLMGRVFDYDTTHRIFGSAKFKKDLQYGWLKKQSSYAKKIVDDLVHNIYENDWMFKNDYCYIGPPEQFFKDHFARPRITPQEFMVYVAPPKDNVLYYKILPKEFSNKPHSFFLNIRFDGFLCHANNQLQNINTIDHSLYRDVSLVDCDELYLSLQRHTEPFVFRDTRCWF